MNFASVSLFRGFYSFLIKRKFLFSIKIKSEMRSTHCLAQNYNFKSMPTDTYVSVRLGDQHSHSVIIYVIVDVDLMLFYAACGLCRTYTLACIKKPCS